MGFIMIAPTLLLAVLAIQGASDTTRTAREAYTGCLRTYVERGVRDQMSAEAFTAAFPQQCTAQETAYRDAIIRRETAARASRANAQESAQMEIDDARLNFSERFAMSLPATPVAQAAAQPAAAQPAAAQPAAATTTPQ